MKNLVNIATTIAETNSKIFTIIFIKKDGTERKMLAKTGVKRFLSKKPNKRVVKRNEKIIRVFDMEKKEYRSVNIDSVKGFACGNITIGEWK